VAIIRRKVKTETKIGKKQNRTEEKASPGYSNQRRGENEG
jgi:hypothetical protein